MDPKGKTALITGGARIGQTVAEELAKRGCNIILVFRTSKKKAEKTLRKVKILGADGWLIQADLQKKEEIQKIVPEIERQKKNLDILINMASSYEKTPLETLKEKNWTENLETNLQSAYTLSLSASKLMKKRGQGRIINFSDWVSASGRPRYKEYLPYYVSKTGVLGLTQGLALELAPEILVNSIAPGPILAPSDITPEENREVQIATPLKRWGGSLEIAKTVLFLIETDFVTGECIRVDGGRHLY
jgi:NAD(P)-dependent dehydrogenase (short-subunit alcohol dehydrogenase family)